jgi:hypothetical protein
MIAPNIILTAAHCIAPGTANRVIDYSSKPPALIAPQQVAVHPKYNAQSIAAHRATADVALLRLSARCSASPLLLLACRAFRSPRYRALRLWHRIDGRGQRYWRRHRSRRAAGRHRPARHIARRLVDPQTRNKSSGMGACTGDWARPHSRIRTAAASSPAW